MTDTKPVPVEPECLEKYVRYYAKVSNGGVVQLSSTTILEVLEYIDSLQSALQVAQQERDEAVNVLKAEGIRPKGKSVLPYMQRAEKAEAENAALRLELAQLNGEIPYGN